MFETLIKLGLSDKEAHVYLAALELGQETAQNIARQSGVNRATTYVILEKLMQLGLVSRHEEQKRTIFVAEDPHELVNIIEAQKREAESRRHHLDDGLTQLMAIYNRRAGKPVVRYYEGPEGLEALDRYGIAEFKPNSEMLAITPFDVIEKHFPARRQKSLSERVQRRIISRVIYTHAGGPFPDEVNKRQLREGVYLSRDQFPIDGAITIHPDWGIKLYYFDAARPYGVLIQSPELANNFKCLFELAWLGAKAL